MKKFLSIAITAALLLTCLIFGASAEGTSYVYGNNRFNVEAVSYTHLPLYADVTVLHAPAEGYPLLNQQTTFYVCQGMTCQPPVNKLS